MCGIRSVKGGVKEKVMLSLCKGNRQGFTLVELLIGLAIGLIVLGVAVKIFFYLQNKYKMQEQVTEMQQGVRSTMDMIVKELRSSGLNPTRANFDGISTDTSQLVIKSDRNGDGDTNDANEEVIYSYDAGNYQIDRNVGGGRQPTAENIKSFVFTCLDADGVATTNSKDIRQVRVTIVGMTASQDSNYTDENDPNPNTKHKRKYMLDTHVTLRNAK